MNRRLLILIASATALVAAAVWLNWTDRVPDEFRPKALDAAALAGLKPDLDGDLALREHLASRVGFEPEAWKGLPEPGRLLWATLYCEEIDRTLTWPQVVATAEEEGSGAPGLSDAVQAYEALSLPAAAKAAGTLSAALDRDRERWRAWMRSGASSTAPRPDPRPAEGLAAAWRGHLGAVRKARLDYARAHAEDLGIR